MFVYNQKYFSSLPQLSMAATDKMPCSSLRFYIFLPLKICAARRRARQNSNGIFNKNDFSTYFSAPVPFFGEIYLFMPARKMILRSLEQTHKRKPLQSISNVFSVLLVFWFGLTVSERQEKLPGDTEKNTRSALFFQLRRLFPSRSLCSERACAYCNVFIRSAARRIYKMKRFFFRFSLLHRRFHVLTTRPYHRQSVNQPGMCVYNSFTLCVEL